MSDLPLYYDDPWFGRRMDPIAAWQDKLDHDRFDRYLLELLLVNGLREGHDAAEVLQHPATRTSYHHSTRYILGDYDTNGYELPEIYVDGENVPRVRHDPRLLEELGFNR